jgi:DNA topoisomerase-1
LEKEKVEEDEEMEEENLNIPELNEGEILKLDKYNPKQHFTQPPARYSEATLVRVLEENGIGRPSTYAPTITTILARGYVEKIQKMLCPTELGKIVTGIMKNHFKKIVDVDFTAQMENSLDKVEEGLNKWVEVLHDFYGEFEGVLKEAEKNIGEIQLKDIESDIVCNKCGKNLVYKLGKKGKKFLACPGFPNCRNTMPIMEDANAICPLCEGKIYFKETRRSRKYIGCENYPECNFMSWDKPSGNDCTVCGKFLLTKNQGKSSFEYCSNEKCDFGKENLRKEEAKSTSKGEPKSFGKNAKKSSTKSSTKSIAKTSTKGTANTAPKSTTKSTTEATAKSKTKSKTKTAKKSTKK